MSGRTSQFLAATTMLIALILPNPVMARDADLRLRPDDGEPGETAIARGKDFPGEVDGVLRWADGSELAGFTTDQDGVFDVSFTVPQAEAGDYEVTATAGEMSATDRFTINPVEREEEADEPADLATPPAPESPVADDNDSCDAVAERDVPVANANELETALVEAQPGDRITLADGNYPGNFEATVDGTADRPIMLCGSRQAVMDGGDWGASGYALHLTGDFWIVSGFTVTNAQKGIMADGVSGVIVDGVEVHTIGHEAIHFRANSTDNVVQDSDIHDTGLDNEKFGEGIYFGTAVSNWEKITDGEPDRSDRNSAFRNWIWGTSAESIDIKEGTEGGLIEGNAFDGTGMTGGDSWIDVKGNDYVIRGNVGRNSPQDGFQTHVIDDMEWGRNNVFEQNIAEVNGPGYGFYIHEGEETGNVVACDNEVIGAEAGVANVAVVCGS